MNINFFFPTFFLFYYFSYEGILNGNVFGLIVINFIKSIN